MADDEFTDLLGLKIDTDARFPAASHRRLAVTVILVVTACAVSAAGVWHLYSPAAGGSIELVREHSEASEPAPPGFSAAGYIVARHTISVSSKVSGRIAWVGIEKGDRVREGQVLVQLEDDEFRAQVEVARGGLAAAEARLAALEAGNRPQEIEQARHNLERAKAELKLATLELARTQRLAADGIASHHELDNAVARQVVAQREVNALTKAYELAALGPREEEIEEARGAVREARGRFEYAQALLDATAIRAPIAGTVLERTAEKGELVTAQVASAPYGGARISVATLADLDDLQVELDISQTDFARLAASQNALVSVDAFSRRRYDGIIDQISPIANRQKATIQVKVKILHPDSFLRPEMNAKVEFLDNPEAAESGAFIVPPAASPKRRGRATASMADDGRPNGAGGELRSSE